MRLRLGKLQDRTPVKLTISVMPGLHNKLQAYADIYFKEYGTQESVTELIPAMLDAYLQSDKEFRKRHSVTAKGGET